MKSPGSHHLPRLGTLAPELPIFRFSRLQYLAFELGPKGKAPGPRETLRMGTVFPGSEDPAGQLPSHGASDTSTPRRPCSASLPERQHPSNALPRHELPLTELVELLRWDPSYANRNSYIIIHCNCKYPECPR